MESIMTIQERTQEAVIRYNNGEKFSTSTSIDEDTILAGYGSLDYDFEFPLPPSIIEKEFGATSWDVYFELKGIYRYKSTNLENGKVALIGRWSKEDIEKMMKMPENEKFKIERV